ncbi:hypothetical protein KIN20_006592 [Parelaphostrongylus tenuis]|uniref:Uncharacterized protein n=1 Tax=Parelaphostrongylus tenuis TaxID=148309 RepID=A0AAD5QJF3_PARTN|nr:hypothetical protein KIN20_006592 [Parelaphostrongylus tenuis]
MPASIYYQRYDNIKNRCLQEKIREAESSSASEAEEEEEDQTDVEGYLNEVSDIIGMKDLESKSNQGTRSSKASDSGSGDMSIEMEATKVRSDVSHSSNGRVLNETKDPPRNPRLPDPQMSAKSFVYTR